MTTTDLTMVKLHSMGLSADGFLGAIQALDPLHLQSIDTPGRSGFLSKVRDLVVLTEYRDVTPLHVSQSVQNVPCLAFGRAWDPDLSMVRTVALATCLDPRAPRRAIVSGWVVVRDDHPAGAIPTRSLHLWKGPWH